ncbi:MAG TPA: imidazole glycerol phosphate synthase subunit HisH [Nitrospiria bacterium]|jgi:glutamine amidotransferase|nr:imidazole glycerol phosphate synthase subunit HisH [Nitrospiria bacterium]
MIAIIDYGMGNLRSVSKAFERLGFAVNVTRNPRQIDDASHVVLPGVGAFPDCMRNLEELGLIDPVLRTLSSGKPFLGVCLGLQLLFTESEEFGLHKGLGWIRGRVVRFPDAGLKVPHMGWNTLEIRQATPLLQGLPMDAMFYFVHSYYGVPDDSAVIASTTEYGQPFASSIAVGNVFACQFHPEKSQAVGLKLLRNFAQCR